MARLTHIAFGAVAALAAMLPLASPAQVSPAPYTSATWYDVEHRVTGTIAADPDGTGVLRHAAVRNSYDAGGRLVRVEKGELAAWQSEALPTSALLSPYGSSTVATTASWPNVAHLTSVARMASVSRARA